MKDRMRGQRNSPVGPAAAALRMGRRGCGTARSLCASRGAGLRARIVRIFVRVCRVAVFPIVNAGPMRDRRAAHPYPVHMNCEAQSPASVANRLSFRSREIAAAGPLWGVRLILPQAISLNPVKSMVIFPENSAPMRRRRRQDLVSVLSGHAQDEKNHLDSAVAAERPALRREASVFRKCHLWRCRGGGGSLQGTS